MTDAPGVGIGGHRPRWAARGARNRHGPPLVPADWTFVKETEEGVLLLVRVQPGAARTELAGTDGGQLRLRVAAPPVQGRANEAARRYLAELLGVSGSAVVLVGGATTRSKRFLLRGAEAGAVRRRLGRLLGEEES